MSRNRTVIKAFASLALIYAGAAIPAFAADDKALGTFDAWSAKTSGAGKSLTCYMVSLPQKADLVDRRDDIYILVYHRPEEKDENVVQVDIGYAFKPGSEAVLSVDGKSWKLFTKEGSAWALTPEDDKAIVAAMRKGTKLTVKGTSSRGNETTDQYSLKGVARASEAIAKACKVKLP
jgi:invasion associated locus B (IalB) protein